MTLEVNFFLKITQSLRIVTGGLWTEDLGLGWGLWTVSQGAQKQGACAKHNQRACRNFDHRNNTGCKP